MEIFCARQHLDYRNRAQITELGHWFRDSELKLHSLHSPMYSDEVWGRSGPQAVINITEPVKSKRIAMLDEIKRALEIAETDSVSLPDPAHRRRRGRNTTSAQVDAAFTALEEISVVRPRSAAWRCCWKIRRTSWRAPSGCCMFLGITHLNLNICLDVGHAHMNEGVETAYRFLKSRIRSTHVHDNNGKEDLHLFPMHAAGRQGTIDWPRDHAASRALRTTAIRCCWNCARCRIWVRRSMRCGELFDTSGKARNDES